MIRWLFGLLLAGLLLASACKREGGSECNAQVSCGFGKTCVNGYCEGASCSTSSDCPIQSFCDQSGECSQGCELDSDCYPGEACDSELSSCAPQACEDTHLDCGFREFCNSATGECYDAGERYCKPCNDDRECGAGNLCYAGACLADCSDGGACPAGFECAPFQDQAGNVVAFQCFTYCWLYNDYQPGSF